EAAFLAKASGLDFPVAKPWGESQPYDFVVDSGQGFVRVQVKSARYHQRSSEYFVKAWKNSGPYTEDEIDFFVNFLVPENVWYIVPIDAVGRRKKLYFNPRGPGKAAFEKYREAWCLLACTRKVRGWKDI